MFFGTSKTDLENLTNENPVRESLGQHDTLWVPCTFLVYIQLLGPTRGVPVGRSRSVHLPCGTSRSEEFGNILTSGRL